MAIITRQTIITAMARAFFASAYADAADDAGQSIQGEIMDKLPEPIDSEAMKAGERLAIQMEMRNDRPLDDLYICNTGNLTPEDWGHYAAMQAMGHGVGLWEHEGADNVIVPDLEFSKYSLNRDYFD